MNTLYHYIECSQCSGEGCWICGREGRIPMTLNMLKERAESALRCYRANPSPGLAKWYDRAAEQYQTALAKETPREAAE